MAYEVLKGLDMVSEFSPDLILVDIELPDTDGFEILKTVKSDPKTKDVPVVIISNLAEKDNISKGISLGAKDYLPKSQYHLNDIVKKIKDAM